MKSVALLVTGELERALGKGLTRLFADVHFRPPVKLDGFTSTRLLDRSLPEGVRTCVDKIAAQIVAEVEPGRRDTPPEMVLFVDDLELHNQSSPERVIEHLRDSVQRHIDDFSWPSHASRERARNRVRERCSFHLMDPMIEAYFFGEPAALVRAGAKRRSTVDPRIVDLERFLVRDADFLAWPDLGPGEEMPPWARPQRASHPKAYLQFLCDPTGTVRRAYRETEVGRRALGELDWGAVLEPKAHVRFLRSLILDIADRFGESAVTERFAGTSHPLTWPGRGAVMRNV
jgi:hypothetical protein